ncbi:hypothetical protein NPX13_g9945 [Xylaria arbuscula]|uniref:Terpene synthase n=1 Tax=Xylaria arbuscula TaxID=114810 RepID=A0A9W8N5M7_9PEZI|nr:hypothetical protein NPX13_g9945 [Xylaria arbuscula]
MPPKSSEGGAITFPSTARIPDLCSSIMARKAVVNPNYFQVKAEGERWLAQIMKWDKKASAKNTRTDLCYLVALWAPTCDEEALRVMLDWQHWVFLFDDQFDEGHLRCDPIAAREEVDFMMTIMTDDAPPVGLDRSPVGYIFQRCWQAIKRRSSLELQQRYREQHWRYFEQLVVQIQRAARSEILTSDVQTYMELRRGTIGVYPGIALTEWAQNVKLPESVFSHNSIQECMRVSSELVVLVNDVLSYRKDLELGVDYNLISLLQTKGLTTQQSLDQIGIMYNDCYKRWYTALAELPCYGEEIDREVLKFIDVCSFVASGNLHWSFKTGRYLGTGGHDVYKTKIMYLPRGSAPESKDNEEIGVH